MYGARIPDREGADILMKKTTSKVRGRKVQDGLQLLIWGSLTHFTVDLVCAWLILNQIPGTSLWYLKILIYNFLAFAGQLPVGILLDGIHVRIPASVLGCFLCLLCLAPGFSSFALVVTAGLGNALFHTGSGAGILHRYQNSFRASGIFVSTGALGIFLGGVLPLSPGGRLPAGILLVLLAGYGLRLCFHGTAVRTADSAGSGPDPSIAEFSQAGYPSAGRTDSSPTDRLISLLCPLCLFLVAGLRSFEGMIFSFSWNTGIWQAFLLCGAVFLGKCLGGFTAGHLGSLKASVFSLGPAAVLLAFPDIPVLSLAGVLLFNMTMPVTLTELSLRLPGRPGTAFGLLTFALYLGFLPVYAGTAKWMQTSAAYVVLTVVSLILLTSGLLLPHLYWKGKGKKKICKGTGPENIFMDL